MKFSTANTILHSSGQSSTAIYPTYNHNLQLFHQECCPILYRFTWYFFFFLWGVKNSVVDFLHFFFQIQSKKKAGDYTDWNFFFLYIYKEHLHITLQKKAMDTAM